MSGPSFFQTLMGRTFYEGTMPRLVKVAERIANGLERLAVQGGKDPKRDRLIVTQMAKDLLAANDDCELDSEYLRGQVEMLCSTAELMATIKIDADGLGDQRRHVMVLFDEYREEETGIFEQEVAEFYFGPEEQKE